MKKISGIYCLVEYEGYLEECWSICWVCVPPSALSQQVEYSLHIRDYADENDEKIRSVLRMIFL